MHIILTANSCFNIVNFRLGLVRALVEHGHRVTVLAPVDAFYEKIKEIGAEFHHITIDKKGLSPIRDGALCLRFAGFFSRLKPDVVLSFTIKNNIFGGLAARMTGTEFVPCITGLGTAFLSASWLQRLVVGLYKPAFAKCQKVLFQNGDDEALFLRLGIVRQGQVIHVPGSGVDTLKFSPAEYPKNKQTTFLMVARLLKDKGVFEFVEAARTAQKGELPFRFWLVGGTDHENRMAVSPEMVQSWVNANVVEYFGETDDVRPLVAQANCVVLPSYREGLPRSLLEACSMARPVVATDVPGCRDVVEHGNNGYLCQVQDFRSLLDAMERFSNLTFEEQRKMGQEGRVLIESRFSETEVLDVYLALIGHIK